MTVFLRNFVSCERVDEDVFYTLRNVRFRWPSPPSFVDFWMDILNPAEEPVTVQLRAYRGRQLAEYSEAELIPVGLPALQVALQLPTAHLEAKSYSIHAVVNGVSCGKLGLDFGARDA